MALSEKTLSNLLDVMQKLSLAIGVVSVALFSNFVLSQQGTLSKAAEELKRLFAIVEKIKDRTPREVLFSELIETSFHIESEEGFALGDVTLGHFRFDDESHDSEWYEKRFGDAASLDELRNTWDTACSVERYIPQSLRTVVLSSHGFGGFLLLHASIRPPATIGKRGRFDLALLSPPVRDHVVPGPLEITPEKVILYYELSPESDRVKPLLRRAFRLWNQPHYPSQPGKVSIYPVESVLTRNANLETSWSAVPDNTSLFAKYGLVDESQPFARQFPHLDQLVDSYQKQRLSSLLPSLEEAAKISNEQVEVFGVKFSSALVPILGTPLLLIIELQFWSLARYLVSHVGRLEIEQASAWSFLLPTRTFFILGLTTILVLPTVCSALGLCALGNFRLAIAYGSLVLSIFFFGGASTLEFSDIRFHVIRAGALFDRPQKRWTDVVRQQFILPFALLKAKFWRNTKNRDLSGQKTTE
jgi:hypothetical protein